MFGRGDGQRSAGHLVGQRVPFGSAAVHNGCSVAIAEQHGLDQTGSEQLEGEMQADQSIASTEFRRGQGGEEPYVVVDGDGRHRHQAAGDQQIQARRGRQPSDSHSRMASSPDWPAALRT